MITPELKKLEDLMIQAAKILGVSIFFTPEIVVDTDGNIKKEFNIAYPTYDDKMRFVSAVLPNEDDVCKWLELEISKAKAA